MSHDLNNLLTLMARLRDPERGCPWDIKQTFATIAPHTLEEACEVVEAIEREDFDNLREELGDLLLQVIFHAQMASEAGYFDFADISQELLAKLIRRHPHVFPSGRLEPEDGFASSATAMSAEQVLVKWDEIKASEKKATATMRPVSPIEARPVGRARKIVPIVDSSTASPKLKLITTGKVSMPASRPTAVSSPTTETASWGTGALRFRYAE